MKTNRSMTRTLGLVALSLFAALTSPEARADSIQPRYRIEDLGLLSKWGGSNPRFYLDGTVHRHGYLPGSNWNIGEYRTLYVDPSGVPERIEFYKGASDTNLLTAQQSRDFAGRVADLTANGQILVYDIPSFGSPSIYDLNSKSFTPIVSSPAIGEPGSKAQVFAINSLGQMVGQQDSKAILYDSFDATPILLKDLVEAAGNWRFSEATDISETGDIIVRAYADGEPGYHAFKLVPITPVPEPSMILIFGALSFGIILRSRHRIFNQTA